MLESNIGIEFEDRQTADEIAALLKTLPSQTPPGVISVRESTSAGGLEAGDWHFLELLIAFGTGVGAGAAKKIGESVVGGVTWLAEAIRDRLARPTTTRPAPPVATASPESGGKPTMPTVRMEYSRHVETVSISITGATSNEELRRFAEAAARLAEKSP